MVFSHNTFTYLPPLDWWGWMLLPFTRCQSKSLSHQPIQGVDIRLRKESGEWWICHGPVRFCSLSDGLEEIRKEGIQDVRVLLEPQQEITMMDYYNLESTLHRCLDIRFWTGRRKSDWRKVLNFPDLPDLYQHVGSMQGGILGKICPWLWWFLIGRKKEATGKGTNISLDFI